jgi:hypothetical protein
LMLPDFFNLNMLHEKYKLFVIQLSLTLRYFLFDPRILLRTRSHKPLICALRLISKTKFHNSTKQLIKG